MPGMRLGRCEGICGISMKRHEQTGPDYFCGTLSVSVCDLMWDIWGVEALTLVSRILKHFSPIMSP
jgi:hypothetical protein